MSAYYSPQGCHICCTFKIVECLNIARLTYPFFCCVNTFQAELRKCIALKDSSLAFGVVVSNLSLGTGMVFEVGWTAMSEINLSLVITHTNITGILP